MMQPFNHEANTRLLLQYGADLTAVESNRTGGGLTPLQVVLEELMDAAQHSIMLWKMVSVSVHLYSAQHSIMLWKMVSVSVHLYSAQHSILL